MNECWLNILALLAIATTTAAEPLAYRHETRQKPRPLHIYILTVDLRSVEMTTLIAPDPDGDGPAEAQLVKPSMLAGQTGIVAAVNANAFASITGEVGPWTNGLPVNICGWAFDGRRQVSPAETNYASFWIAPDGTGHIGQPATNLPARTAVAGFTPLLRDGEAYPFPNKALHPRTALGLDRNGQQLCLMVVDGRQSGYSEGVSLIELSELMKEFGCWNALNLDGGGSSILLLATNRTELTIMNRPSDPKTRPVPVMLGVRRRP